MKDWGSRTIPTKPREIFEAKPREIFGILPVNGPQVGDCRADHFGRRAAHQAGNRQGELGCHLPVAGRDKAAAEPDQTVDRKRHVLVVCADDADIVTIVPDGRSQGASLQTTAFDKAATDIAIAPVPLQHAHL